MYWWRGLSARIIGHGHVTDLPLRETLLQRDAKEKVTRSRCTVFKVRAREVVGYRYRLFDDNGVEYSRHGMAHVNIKLIT